MKDPVPFSFLMLISILVLVVVMRRLHMKQSQRTTRERRAMSKPIQFQDRKQISEFGSAAKWVINDEPRKRRDTEGAEPPAD